jgi:hypothetical protein
MFGGREGVVSDKKTGREVRDECDRPTLAIHDPFEDICKQVETCWGVAVRPRLKAEAPKEGGTSLRRFPCEEDSAEAVQRVVAEDARIAVGSKFGCKQIGKRTRRRLTRCSLRDLMIADIAREDELRLEMQEAREIPNPARPFER